MSSRQETLAVEALTPGSAPAGPRTDPARASFIAWPGAILIAVAAVVLASGAVAAFLALPALWPKASAAAGAEESAEDPARPQRLDVDTLVVPPEVLRSLGITTGEVRRASQPRSLPPLSGSLALDTNRMARVHPRFAGEVVALGTVNGGETSSANETEGSRALRFGDRVQKDQLLAVVWSKDLGEKKSELVDALSRLRLDEDTLARLKDVYSRGATPERTVREAERTVEADLIAVNRAERTLRSWRLTDAEIAAVRTEAAKIVGRKADRADDAQWARVEVRSPQDGIILEKNFAVGDLVDTSTDLFKVADLSKLVVWAHVYEEDLPALQKLPRPTPWAIRMPSAGSAVRRGSMEQVGEVIDPNQHTALVTGRVDNSDGSLRVGQYVTATIELPPPRDELEVPTTALVEDGKESIVFVQPSPGETRFVRRRVSVVRRFSDVVHLRVENLQPGEQVVTTGAIFLRDALDEIPLPKEKEGPGRELKANGS